ncbi:hypothetical protein AAVH_13176 [Aphelenchoides avenae]|nr:hypothetical protein AAVH_13176 [Aphelenchus avenae]
MLAVLISLIAVTAIGYARDGSLDCLERCLAPQDSPLSSSNASSTVFLLATPDPRCNDYYNAFHCIGDTCPPGDIAYWYFQGLRRLVWHQWCNPRADQDKAKQFFDQVEDFSKKFHDAVADSSCMGPVEDAEAFCKQAIECVYKSIYKTIARKGKYSWYVRKWTAVKVKVSYAIKHNNNFPEEKIPAKCIDWILESPTSDGWLLKTPAIRL